MSAPPPPTAPPPPAGGADAGRASEAGDGVPAGTRRLTRRRRGRLVGGVAAGLARYLGVDPVVVRIGFVVLAFVPFPGFGVLVYLAMLLLVPEQDADGAVVPTRFTERSPGFWVGIGLIGLATFALLGVIGDGRLGGLLPLLLIGLGVALWVDADRRPTAAGAPPPAPAPPASAGADWPAADSPAASAAEAPVAGRAHDVTAPVPPVAAEGVAGPREPASDVPVWGAGGHGDPPAPPPAPGGPAWTPPPVERRPRSPLGRVTLGLALLAGGAAWLVDVIGPRSVPVASMLAVVLLVLGLGLLVGSVVGRARWLIAVVAFVLPVTLVAAAVEDLGIDLRGTVGSHVVTVLDAEQVGDPLAVGVGELEVDLRDLPDVADDEDVLVEASIGAGSLRVTVPEGVGLTGRVTLQVGELTVVDSRTDGVGLERTISVPAEPGRPTYTLELRGGVGEIIVQARPGAGATDTTEVQP